MFTKCMPGTSESVNCDQQMLNSAKSDYKHCAKCRNEKHRPCEATREEEINRMYIVKGVSPFNPKCD